MVESITSEGRLEAHERHKQALQLRMAGMTYDEIAKQLGYASTSGAYDAVISAMKVGCRELAEEVRDLELSRLDRMLMAIWPEALAGNVSVIDRVLKLMERRAKYGGLDKPTPIALTSPDGMKEYGAEQPLSFTDRLASLVALNERVRARGVGPSPVAAEQSVHAPGANGAANGIPSNGLHS